MTPGELISELNRFWSRVDKSGDCWLWMGAKNNHGYGRFTFWHGGNGTRCFAHRLALEMSGTHLTPDDVLLHSCDTPACVNPAHLSVGTQAQNIQDAKSKGRMNTDGLYAGARRACKTCGDVFVGSPNRRYCDAHQPKSKSKRLRISRQAQEGAA